MVRIKSIFSDFEKGYDRAQPRRKITTKRKKRGKSRKQHPQAFNVALALLLHSISIVVNLSSSFSYVIFSILYLNTRTAYHLIYSPPPSLPPSFALSLSHPSALPPPCLPSAPPSVPSRPRSCWSFCTRCLRSSRQYQPIASPASTI